MMIAFYCFVSYYDFAYILYSGSRVVHNVNVKDLANEQHNKKVF